MPVCLSRPEKSRHDQVRTVRNKSCSNLSCRSATLRRRCPVVRAKTSAWKDFDPTFGVALVATAAVISAIFYRYVDFIAYGCRGADRSDHLRTLEGRDRLLPVSL